MGWPGSHAVCGAGAGTAELWIHECRRRPRASWQEAGRCNLNGPVPRPHDQRGQSEERSKPLRDGAVVHSQRCEAASVRPRALVPAHEVDEGHRRCRCIPRRAAQTGASVRRGRRQRDHRRAWGGELAPLHHVEVGGEPVPSAGWGGARVWPRARGGVQWVTRRARPGLPCGELRLVGGLAGCCS